MESVATKQIKYQILVTQNVVDKILKLKASLRGVANLQPCRHWIRIRRILVASVRSTDPHLQIHKAKIKA